MISIHIWSDVPGPFGPVAGVLITLVAANIPAVPIALLLRTLRNYSTARLAAGADSARR